ncbi:MAG: DNA integrity scanning protein DisA nucleotide-binding domain protein [Gloeomargarita sp. DG02_4_bins_56]
MERWDALLVAGVLALLPVLLGRRGIGVALAGGLAVLAQAQHLPWTAQGLGLLALLMGVGPSWYWGRRPWRPPSSDIDVMLKVVTECIQRRWGALLILLAPPAAIPSTLPGVKLEATLSAELLLSLLCPLSPLHDGAVVVGNGLVLAAGVIVPISTQSLALGLGTRHRAALGVTEYQPEGMAIVVSEETGQVALAYRGKLLANLSPEQLRQYLEQEKNRL